MVEMGRLVSLAYREFLVSLDQWGHQGTRVPSEIKAQRDLLEFLDLLALEEILVKTVPPVCLDHQASPDLLEREEWLGPQAPEDSRECRVRQGKMERLDGMVLLVCRVHQA